MLPITIPSTELWDPVNRQFIYTKEQSLVLEHSLVSISRWEMKWGKPFLTNNGKTDEEIRDYVRCMTITQHVDPSVYRYLTDENLRAIQQYIDAPMTATWFGENEKSGKRGKSKKVVTNELIYYWMFQLNIPLECEKWHFNRLMTLIRVCNEENKPPKKLSMNDIMKRNSKLNEERRAMSQSKG